MKSSVSNKCKAFTSLEQSKKLSEILPIESADNHYWRNGYNNYICGLGNSVELKEKFEEKGIEYLPCWSLAALIDILPKKYYPVKDHETNLILGKPKDEWCALYWDSTGMQDGEQTLADNPVDACVEMIIKLKENNLL